MEPELPPPPTDPFIILGEQLDIFLIYFDRPLVRVQFFALVIIVLFAFGLEIVASRRIDQKLDEWVNSPNISDYRRPFFRLLNAMRYGSFSLGGVILLLSTIFLFEQVGQPTTILRQVIPLFLFVLTYQMIIAAIYLRFSRPLIEPLHRYVFSPLALLIFLFLITGSFINLARMGSVVVVDVLSFQLTLERIFWVGLTVYAIFVVAYLLQQSTVQLMARQTDQRAAAVASLLVVARFAVLFAGIFVVAAVLGIDASTLALVGGGLSVGIGIGLQSVVANFVSGIILIFEQSLRPGDVININGQIGIVDDLNVRATTIRTNDNVALIIPNERFFSSEVVTYTKDTSLVRVDIPFRVSHRTEPAVVRDLAVNTAVAHPLVSDKQAPFVAFLGFGESSLDFSLFVWMEKPQIQLLVRSDLYYQLWDVFKQNDIEIPFPQRDLNLGTGWQEALGTHTAVDSAP